LGVAAALLLAGCSTPPTTLSNPRDEITLQWEQGKTSRSNVETVAQRHCEAWGKNSVPNPPQSNGRSVTQTFLCR
jgi:uncharacterized lipoprotein YajG